MRHARTSALLVILFVASFAARPASARDPAAPAVWAPEHLDVRIPVRDGAWLSADVFLPQAVGRYPCVLVQTPYDKRRMRRLVRREEGHVSEVGRGAEADLSVALDRRHYAYVVVDWRGFHGSKEARRGKPKRGLDGYDSVEWCAAQPWCNGRVGTWGGSALGKAQFDTAREHPPHLVCCVPLIAAMGQAYDFYYDGGVPRGAHLRTLDFLGFGVSSLVRRAPHASQPIWRLARRRTYRPDLVHVPCLLVTGWWDNYTDRVIETFEDLVTKGGGATRAHSRLLVGPWDHVSVGLAAQGDLSFEGAALESGHATKAFLDLHLRGVPDASGRLGPRIRYYSAGGQGWRSAERWSGLERATLRFHLHADGRLDTDTVAPGAGRATSRGYTYDPRSPSPTLGGANLPPLPHGPRLQDALNERQDVLRYATAALTRDLEVNGNVLLDLSVTCDRVDLDVVARLCDVHPDGRAFLVGDAALRAKLRSGRPEALVPGRPVALRLRFPATAYTFAKGHAIALYVSSGNAPRYEPNSHTGADSWDAASALPVHVRIHHEPGRPAVLTVPRLAR